MEVHRWPVLGLICSSVDHHVTSTEDFKLLRAERGRSSSGEQDSETQRLIRSMWTGELCLVREHMETCEVLILILCLCRPSDTLAMAPGQHHRVGQY